MGLRDIVTKRSDPAFLEDLLKVHTMDEGVAIIGIYKISSHGCYYFVFFFTMRIFIPASKNPMYNKFFYRVQILQLIILFWFINHKLPQITIYEIIWWQDQKLYDSSMTLPHHKYSLFRAVLLIKIKQFQNC